MLSSKSCEKTKCDRRAWPYLCPRDASSSGSSMTYLHLTNIRHAMVVRKPSNIFAVLRGNLNPGAA